MTSPRAHTRRAASARPKGAGDVGGRDHADAVADDGVRLDAPGAQLGGEGDGDGEQGRLGDGGVVEARLAGGGADLGEDRRPSPPRRRLRCGIADGSGVILAASAMAKAGTSTVVAQRARSRAFIRVAFRVGNL